MNIVKKSERVKINPTASTVIYEYATQDRALGGALSEINGRYPERGFALNTRSKELVYVVSGSGEILTQNSTTKISEGDIIFIDVDEQFAWVGNMVIMMSTAPKFDPAQHFIKE